MANSQQHKRTKSKKIRSIKPVTIQKTKKQFLTKTRALIGGIVTIYCIFAAFPTFYSRVWLSPSVSINPNDPFATRFEVSNIGSFSVYNVHIKAEFSATIATNTFNRERLSAKPDIIPELEPGQRPVLWIPVIANIPCNENDKVDLRLEITFRPSFVWWHRTLHQRFVTIRTQGGLFKWTEYSYNSP
jgi:hypothetical protein